MAAMPPGDDILASLNPVQREAVEALGGPVLVLAGPGSGKTRVLTHRVAFLLQTAGVPPWRVMAVTFTNKAAREMTARLATLVGPQALADVTIGTFHAICARILRREAVHVGLDGRFVIYDTADQERAVKRALEQLRLDEKAFRPAALLAAISSAKNELVRPAAWQAHTYFEEVAGRVYERYQQLLRASNALDFDDLLLETAFLLRDQPTVRERYRARYSHVLVDEFQDTNTAQYALIKALAAADVPGAAHNVFVVGDEDQSIYRWRGADYRNIQRFRRDFPEARVVLLEQNYRSTQTILDAARAVIDRNRQRTPKALWTEAGQGAAITVFEAHDENEEAAYVVREIEAAVLRGTPYGHFAVMYRTNAQSRALEDALVRRRVPYQLVGATRFYERREVKDVLAYLRLAHNPLDAMALERVVNIPPRGIGPGTWGTLTDWATAAGLPVWPALQIVAEDKALGVTGRVPLDNRGRNALLAFHDILAELIAAREAVPVPELLTLALDASGYERWLRDGSEEGDERWANVQELRGVAEDFAGFPPGAGLAAMLEAVALVSDVDSLAEAPDRLTLLTLHAAKGLEFDTVFITGLEENSLPHMRAQDDPDAIAEERRLFYVGLTRARRKIYLTHTFRRTVFGSADLREPSRFLADVPVGLLAGRRAGAVPARPPLRQARYTWANPSSVAPPPRAAEATFQPGDKVVHGHFGSGVVVSSVARDGDQEVTVAFEGLGVKKLLQSLARLEKQA
jgi:DNA helicase II / ATP-dependent DNA helicase PcrA